MGQGFAGLDKQKLKQALLDLTEAELALDAGQYARHLKEAMLDDSETIDTQEQSYAAEHLEIADAYDEAVEDAAARLAYLRGLDFAPRDDIGPGAAFSLGARHFVVATATAAFECDGRSFLGISAAAPIYKALEGAKAGDKVEFRGKLLKVSAVK